MNVVFPEMEKDLTDGPERIQEHEIDVSIDGAKHAGVDLIHEFLTIVGVTFRRHPDVGAVFQGRDRRFRGDDGHAILQAKRGKTAGCFGRHGVSNAQTARP